MKGRLFISPPRETLARKLMGIISKIIKFGGTVIFSNKHVRMLGKNEILGF